MKVVPIPLMLRTKRLYQVYTQQWNASHLYLEEFVVLKDGLSDIQCLGPGMEVAVGKLLPSLRDTPHFLVFFWGL